MSPPALVLAAPALIFASPAIVARGAAAAPRVLPAGKLPNDARLGPLKDLNGYFPFHAEPDSRSLEATLPDGCGGRFWWRRGFGRCQPKRRSSADLRPRGARGVHGRKGHARKLPRLFRHRQSLSARRANRASCRACSARTGIFRTAASTKRRSRKSASNSSMGPSGSTSAGAFRCKPAACTLARMGCVAFMWDMVGYADSVQIPLDARPRLQESAARDGNADSLGLLQPAGRIASRIDHGAANV